jgi:hypothetical protein
VDLFAFFLTCFIRSKANQSKAKQRSDKNKAFLLLLLTFFLLLSLRHKMRREEICFTREETCFAYDKQKYM